MLSYLIYAAAYWMWCAAYFQFIQRPLFILSNPGVSREPMTVRNAAGIYRHGFVSDAIIASYLTALPLIMAAVHQMAPAPWLAPALTVYNAVIALVTGLVSAGDAMLYRFWNSKVDASVFAYMRSIKGATASVSGRFIAGWAGVWLLSAVLFFAGAWTVGDAYCRAIDATRMPVWGYAVVILTLFMAMAGLFAVIRGLKIRPNNPSVVYFSSDPFFNHAALNPAYNLIYSLGTRNEFEGRFVAFDRKECQRLFQPMFPVRGRTMTQLLNTDRPNVIIVVWESFGAEFCGQLGGRSDVTPNFDRLCREGVLFTNCRASSFRTDRALPAIFCGLPGQPTTSIVRYTRKLPKLPSFVRDLRSLGYRTTAVHGGDLTIMHKSDFYLSSGHTRLIAQRDLPRTADTGKWGVHDYPVMDRVADYAGELSRDGQPWLITVQTLSSHEPFKVPYNRLSDEADNSMAYTDAALGHLVERLKRSALWSDLLLVVVADHGLNRSDSNLTREAYCHIPLLMAGGAVNGPRRIDTMMSQTDLAATLLGQFGLPHDDYPFSRDVLADSYTMPTALHTYANGFLFSDATGTTDYDNVGQTAAPGTADKQRERRGKAILQTLYDYINKL